MDKIDILFKEYETIGKEINIERQRYNQQTNFVNMYLTVIITLVGSVLIKLIGKDAESLLNNSVSYLGLLFFVALLAGAIMGFYLVASTMEALFAVYILGTRRAAIEKLINLQAGKEELLILDGKVWPYFYFEFDEVKPHNRPQYFVGLWIVLLLIVTNVMLTILCALFTGNNILVYCYAILVGAATWMSIHQWLDLNTVVLRSIIDKIKEQSGLPEHIELKPCLWKAPVLKRDKSKAG